MDTNKLHHQFVEYMHRVPGVQEEIHAANIIQQMLLQDEIPQCKGLSCLGVSIPAFQLSGDYYDFIFDKKNNKYWILIGDVMGKGIPAALIMVMLRATVRCLVMTCDTPSDLLYQANNLLWNDLTRLKAFTTLYVGVFNVDSRTFSYASAGHPNPIYLQHQSMDEPIKLQAKGTIIGVLKNREYKDEHIQLKKGDLMVFCTDGVLEAMDRENNQYGYGKLIEILKKHECGTLDQLFQEILYDVNLHSAESRRDDLTIVAVRCEGVEEHEQRDHDSREDD